MRWQYKAHAPSGDSQHEESVQDAALTVCDWAIEDLHDSGEWNEDGGYAVTIEIGHADAKTREVTGADEDEWARLRGYDHVVEEVVFVQVAAAVSADTMRRALALAEAHDPELAAELRASLVTP